MSDLSLINVSSDDPPRGFHAYVAVFAMLVLVGTGAFNAIVDPNALFPSDRYEPTAIPRPTVKTELFLEYEGDLDFVVLGSSRLDVVRMPDMAAAGYGDGFNLAIPGSTIEDSVAIYKWLRDERGAPPLVFYNIDEVQMLGFAEPVLPRPGAFQALNQGWNWDLVGKALWETDLHTLLVGVRTFLHHELFGYRENWHGVDPWGTSHYSWEWSVKDPSFDFEREALWHYGRHYGPTYEDPVGVVPERIAALRELVDEVESDGSQLVLMYVPFHPWAIERLKDTPGWRLIEDEVRPLVRQMCSDQVSLVDFRTVDRYGGSSIAAFRDGWHFHPDQTKLMFDYIAKYNPNECP